MVEDARTEAIRTNDDLRTQLVDWLKANDINPNDVPADAWMSLVDDRLTTELWFRNAHGKQQVNPNADKLVKTVATYTVTPPPPDVAEWLRPRCETCGR